MPRHLPTAALLALLASPVMAAGGDDADNGHSLAKARCGGCHAIDAEGASPMTQAPPFRTLGQNYPVENLEEALAEGIFAGHPEMPDDPWTPEDIALLIAYLKTIQTP
jgi:cytochrome c